MVSRVFLLEEGGLDLDRLLYTRDLETWVLARSLTRDIGVRVRGGEGGRGVAG